MDSFAESLALGRAALFSERAFARYRARGVPRKAASAAIWLANEYLLATGNHAAWNGWLERAAGLLADLEPCVEQGWLPFSRGRRVDDPCRWPAPAAKSWSSRGAWAISIWKS